MTAPSLLDELEEVALLVDRIGTSERCINFIRTHHAEIADMAKRLEAAERDARRYRWLRDDHSLSWEDEIDAAMRSAKEDGK